MLTGPQTIKIERMRAKNLSFSREYSLDDSALVKARADLRDLIASLMLIYVLV